MADKEKIEIDGVDVSGCSYYNPLGNYNCGGTKKCSQWTNCYFKQLARKTQECEALKKRNEDNERFYLKQYAKKDSEVLDLTHNLNVKTQECENLKSEEKYLKQCCQKAGEELAKHSFSYDGKEKNLVVQAMELNEKYEKLEKALKEIEEYIYTDCEYNDGCDRNICIRCKYSNVHDKRILDIISKAKDGE